MTACGARLRAGTQGPSRKGTTMENRKKGAEPETVPVLPWRLHHTEWGYINRSDLCFFLLLHDISFLSSIAPLFRKKHFVVRQQ